MRNPKRTARCAIAPLTDADGRPEFKEIRKEWKQKKKAEEAARKAQEDQARADGQTATPADSQTGHEAPPSYSASRNLPPLSYNPATFPNAPQFSNSAASEYSGNYITAGQGYPASPYAQSHQTVYSAGESSSTRDRWCNVGD